MTCSILGCGKKRFVRGWCTTHYYRWARLGDPLAPAKCRAAGEGTISKRGYKTIYVKNVPKKEHWLVAEKAIGHALPKTAVVHHVNGDKLDNRPENLVVCPDNSYHMLLHLRMGAQSAGVDLDWRLCKFCKRYDSQNNLTRSKAENNWGWYHGDCRINYDRKRRGRTSHKSY